jgi:hypothetical protein
MPLSADDTLGPYVILGPIGAGGMGEVYRARDQKLQREVAIKVLPAALAQEPDRLARFEREARVLASLNHPNIAQIYGFEDRALVMELVPGECLKGPLPLATALNYARQIAEGLEAAHEKGIVHRDLKPGNIMITPDGVVKVLDFGLAAVARDLGSDKTDPTNSSTRTMGPTEAGTIMGTAAYMSPEQASGKPVDRRSDIWSFGVVLFEMLTGKRLFGGETFSHTLADVLNGPIDLEQLPDDTPRAIRELLRRCLDRNVKNRLRDIGEARVAIGQTLAEPERENPQAKARRPWLHWAVAAVAAVVVLIGCLAAWRLRQLDYFWTNPMTDAKITRLTDFEGDELDAAISQDGKFAAFLSDRDGPLDAWVTQIGTGNFTNLTKGRFPELLDELAFGIGFSGDGTRLWVRGRPTGAGIGAILTIPVLGGPPRRFLDTVFNVAWSPDGAHIVYATGGPKGDSLFMAEPDGTGPKRIFTTGWGEHAHYPVWSPNGRYIYFIRGGVRLAQADVWAGSGGRRQRRTDHASPKRRALSSSARRPHRGVHRPRGGRIGNFTVWN